MSALIKKEPAPDYVLAKALLRAAEQLGLSQQELAQVIGLHRTSITRLKSSVSLDSTSKTGELALYLIRIARGLYALSGGDQDWIRHFMRSSNLMTGGIPAEQLQSIQGMMRVLQYLDAIRGKI